MLDLKDICVLGRDKRTVKQRPGLEHIWPEVWSDMTKNSQQKEKQHWAKEKPKLDCQKIQRNLSHRSGKLVLQRNFKERAKNMESHVESASPCKAQKRSGSTALKTSKVCVSTRATMR